MEIKGPILFDAFPNLKGKVPWISLLNNIPTPIDRLTTLEKNLELKGGEIYIKRDDKNHNIYGGNKLRKFEFIFGDIIKKKKKGVVTIGGIGTNHGAACAIVCSNMEPPLKCHLYLFPQPITWHVQRSLLIFNYFGAKLHLGGSDIKALFKFLFFQLRHPNYYLMLPGGSPLFGMGSPLGAVGFINAIGELKYQIDRNIIPEPDGIFVPGGTIGTAGGLVAGCKLYGLTTKIYVVAVYGDLLANPSAVKRTANKALKFLYNRDNSIPKIKISEEDFEFITGYLGSNYGIKTMKGQKAVDLVEELEGEKREFKLETTYTGKTIAAMIDFLRQEENKSKKVLFWNTYNSNDLDKYLKETNFNYRKLPKKFHKFYKDKKFQCWQIVDCPKEIKEGCPSPYNHEYRFWKITECKLDKTNRNKAREELENIIQLEDA